MAFILSDRVKESTSTTGTGTYTLGGASTGFESFASIGNSNTTYYCCTDGTDFEVGIGTYTASGTTLARTTILQSSNSDNEVNWSAGTREIFCTLPAEKSVVKDANGDVLFPDNEKAKFGTGGDLEIFHNGSNSFIKDAGTGALVFLSNNHSFRDAANSEQLAQFLQNGAVELYHDNVKKFETTSDGATVTGTLTSDGVFVGDNEEVQFGAGTDLRIFHDGANNIFRGNANPMYIQTDNTIHVTKNNAAETMAKFIGDGAVELYHNNVKKFETTSTGATVTGTLVADDISLGDNDILKIGNGDDFQILHNGSQTALNNLVGNVIFRNYANDADIDIMSDDGSGGTTAYFRADGSTGEAILYHYGTEKLKTNSDGVQILDNGAGSTAVLELGTESTTERGQIKLNGSTANKYSTMHTSNGNLHIDSAGVSYGVYLNWYTSDGSSSTSGTFFGNGNSGQVGRIDGSGNLTLSGDISLGDSEFITFGASNNLQIGFNGNNSTIVDDAAGSLSIQSNGSEINFWDRANSQYMARFVTGDRSELWYNGSVKLATTNTGVTVTGLLSATTKSFDIEHPTKHNMRLKHGSLEGPEHGVYVRGILTDENVIELPDYWTGLVHEDSITAQLTPKGHMQQLYVKEIRDNKVYVENTSATKIDCFYFIQGNRKDTEGFDVEYES